MTDIFGLVGCSALTNVRAINVPLAGRDQGAGAAIVVLVGAMLGAELPVDSVSNGLVSPA